MNSGRNAERRRPASDDQITLADHLKLMAPTLRATVEAACGAVRAAAPRARESVCQTRPPRSSRPMWKIVRYFVGESEVAAIGAFSTHAHLYFQRGIELDGGSGLLEGRGKALRSIRLNAPADASRPGVARLIRSAFRLHAAGDGR
jgi:hypothetical protein